MAHVARAKVRSRKGGAAVPLDETDKQLLNLMQGRFPLDPRPFGAIAALAGLTEDEIWDVGSSTALFAASNRLAHLFALRPNPEFFTMGR